MPRKAVTAVASTAAAAGRGGGGADAAAVATKGKAATAAASSSTSSQDYGMSGPSAVDPSDGKARCWTAAGKDPEMRVYHDSVWGRACRESDALFGHLVMQMMQSGLSWSIVFKKRAAISAALDNFSVKKVAQYGQPELDRLLQDATIIRNRAKLAAIINNAKLIQAMNDGGYPGGWVQFVWDHAPPAGPERWVKDFPKSHMRSDMVTKPEDRLLADGVHPTRGVGKFSAALMQRGFKFVGPTTILSFMQAAGLVNHHKPDCFVFDAINKTSGWTFDPTKHHTVTADTQAEEETKAADVPAPASKAKRRATKAAVVDADEDDVPAAAAAAPAAKKRRGRA